MIDVAGHTLNGYLGISRTWAPGDRVEVEFPMRVRRLYAHPEVRADTGKVALMRGPLVYCLEQADHAEPVSRIRLPRAGAVGARERPDLFGGIVTLEGTGTRLLSNDWNGQLYRASPARAVTTRLTAIPYFLWANREPGAMKVWIGED